LESDTLRACKILIDLYIQKKNDIQIILRTLKREIEKLSDEEKVEIEKYLLKKIP